jgi:hypothetical protein
LFRFKEVTSKRHDDLAEMLVGSRLLEHLAGIIEGEHMIDRLLQFARFDGAPDIPRRRNLPLYC